MSERVVVLTGGVGGAKLVLGLMHVLEPGLVTAVVNTGDDFRHLGLSISPDIDTLLYTLSGKADPVQGWGRAGETWNFMAAMTSLRGPDWFRLGDADVALHVWRTARLSSGETLAEITAHVASSWGIAANVLPMSNDPVSTVLVTDAGTLAFQEYFVARRCAPAVSAIRFEGAAQAQPAPHVVEAILDRDTQAILIAPSNPFLSIDPLLAIPGIKEALASATAPVVAVSPLIANEAVKGPTAKLMAELGVPIETASIVRHYGSLLDGILVDERDSLQDFGIASASSDIMMRTMDDRIRVANAALMLANRLR
jgi:LPPG:FO 2-phospho-L-lactate transferase